jgi:hypothetical protein
VTPADDEAAAPAGVTALVAAYDRCWAALDFVGIQRLWVDHDPQPVYLGDEYAVPAVGADEISRHWSRVGARVSGASMRSRIRLCEMLGADTARCLLLTEWRLDIRGSDMSSTGNSWVTWLLVRRGGEYLICHHMEAQVYFSDDSELGFG